MISSVRLCCTLDEKNPLTGEQVIQLVDRSGNPVIGKNGLPTALTCSVHLHALTKVRLRALWRVQVHRCVNLPKRDLSGTSDAWVSVYATGGEESQFCFQQRSSVIPRNLNPEWNETFDLPLARPGNLLADWLDITAPSLGDAVTKTGEKLLPCATGSGFVAGPTSAQDEKVGFRRLVQRFGLCCRPCSTQLRHHSERQSSSGGMQLAGGAHSNSI